MAFGRRGHRMAMRWIETWTTPIELIEHHELDPATGDRQYPFQFLALPRPGLSANFPKIDRRAPGRLGRRASNRGRRIGLRFRLVNFQFVNPRRTRLSSQDGHPQPSSEDGFKPEMLCPMHRFAIISKDLRPRISDFGFWISAFFRISLLVPRDADLKSSHRAIIELRRMLAAEGDLVSEILGAQVNLDPGRLACRIPTGRIVVPAVIEMRHLMKLRVARNDRRCAGPGFWQQS